MNIFILEDEIASFPRNQILTALNGHDLTIATSFYAGVDLYKAGAYELLLLDHDMEGFYEDSSYPNTGFQFVKQVLVKQSSLPRILLHSQNQLGRRNMLGLLARSGFDDVHEWPFSRAYVDMLAKEYGLSTPPTNKSAEHGVDMKRYVRSPR